MSLRNNICRKFPDAGGAFKVQIYSPYIVINKTGFPFGVRSVKGAGAYKDVAGPIARGIYVPLKLDFHLKFDLYRRSFQEFTFL